MLSYSSIELDLFFFGFGLEIKDIQKIICYAEDCYLLVTVSKIV